MQALSPLRSRRGLPGRLLIAHGMGDDSIPFTESLRLAHAAGPRAHLALLRGFHHTGPRSLLGAVTDLARDGGQLVALSRRALRSARLSKPDPIDAGRGAVAP